MIGQEITFWSI